MNEDLKELYQEVILDHSKHPRNYREMPDANRKIDGYNPLCGDKITLYMKVNGDVVEDVSFQGIGCAISTASASLLTEALKGKTEAEANELFEEFHKLVAEDVPDEAICDDCLGKLMVFAGVRDFPMRVKCATLCWHAMHAALENKDNVVTTE